MLAKLLLTIAVVIAAYAALRQSRAKSTMTLSPKAKTALPWRALRIGAWSMIAIILTGSAWSVVHQWQRAQEIIDIQVVNPATGAIDRYQARRGDIKGRGFRTLDGQQVRIAEFERMILSDLR
ncbi:hypothetical protein Thiowin_03591 [Thiorhodovibrio winogradskyi]|uniref:Uncharacterized protein n=1 Tax=Thiorhodovibrio winogradskyi TaxID=77007 RepID=A0ABZ0SBV2_9GAMM|nr:hypothetical protein [Thiorhodovibrio winogradskyi]